MKPEFEKATWILSEKSMAKLFFAHHRHAWTFPQRHRRPGNKESTT